MHPLEMDCLFLSFPQSFLLDHYAAHEGFPHTRRLCVRNNTTHMPIRYPLTTSTAQWPQPLHLIRLHLLVQLLPPRQQTTATKLLRAVNAASVMKTPATVLSSKAANIENATTVVVTSHHRSVEAAIVISSKAARETHA